eukprot:TRINITY_DN10868_c0_g1_i1.p1 TRINITY_DN10868_c0_g1~~TRINITY_DN10868_c0_g1_i1.p1  ORF type:complete len:346 (+),score=95.03 TRINITY_DN10868_c0_g1_i1:39-1076(+)
MDPSVRNAILQDPQVQAAVRKSGEDALRNPEVQAQIVATMKEKFPEVAAAAKDKVVEWANDPEVQRQAYAFAGMAAEYAYRSVDQVTSLIEQGPAGIRILAFFGGLGSLVKSIMVLMGLLNPVDGALHAAVYVVHAYQMLFAVTTMMFEAPPSWMEATPGFNAYQDMLLEKAKFLSETGGRGLFYGFQGTLWLCFASLTNLEELALGLWFMFMAFLHISMHFGVMPQEVAAKMREAGTEVRQLVGVSGNVAQGGVASAKQEEVKVQDSPPAIQRDAYKPEQPTGKPGTTPREVELDEERADNVQEPLLKKEEKTSPSPEEPPSQLKTAAVQPANKGGKGSCCAVQ